MAEETKQLSIVEDKQRRQVAQYTQEQRASIVELVFWHMSRGMGMCAACAELGVDEGTVHGWIKGEIAWENEYEQLKVVRARSFFERAIDEVETATDPRLAAVRAKYFMHAAALLNPKEFSDKTHSNAHKSGGTRAVSFTLNFAGTPTPTTGSVTIDAQPEDGDLP